MIAFLIETRLSFIQIEANLVDFDVTLNTESINLCNMTKITVKDAFVSVIKINDEGYISLTDMLKAKAAISFSLIGCGIGIRLSFLFLGKLNNPTFNCAEFDIIKSQAG